MVPLPPDWKIPGAALTKAPINSNGSGLTGLGMSLGGAYWGPVAILALNPNLVRQGRKGVGVTGSRVSAVWGIRVYGFTWLLVLGPRHPKSSPSGKPCTCVMLASRPAELSRILSSRRSMMSQKSFQLGVASQRTMRVAYG